MRPTEQHRELYSMLCGDPNGKEIQQRGDTLCVELVHFAVQ